MHLIAQCFLLLLLTVVGAVRVTQKAVGTVLVNKRHLPFFDFTLYRHTSIKFRTTSDSRDRFAITTFLPRSWITYTIWALKSSNCKQANKVKIIKPKKIAPKHADFNSIISTQLDKIKLAQIFCTSFFSEDRNWFPCLPCVRGRLHPINLVPFLQFRNFLDIAWLSTGY